MGTGAAAEGEAAAATGSGAAGGGGGAPVGLALVGAAESQGITMVRAGISKYNQPNKN